MKRWLSLFVCIVPLLATEPGQADPETFRWRDWNAGLEEAAKSSRPVVVNVYTDWCGWCRRMDRDVYGGEEVRAYLTDKFVTIKLNAEASHRADYLGKSLNARTLAAKQFRVTGYPTTIFLKSNGEHLANVPGYVPAERFLTLLHYIGDGHFERGVSFDEFAEKFEGKKGAN